MNLGLRGIMDKDGDIHVWPTLLFDHNLAVLTLLGHDYRVRFRQWDNEPGSKIDFDPGATRDDMIAVCEFVLRVQDPQKASDPALIFALARESGVR